MGVLGIPGKPYEGPDLYLIEEWFSDIKTGRIFYENILHRAMQGLNNLIENVIDKDDTQYYHWHFRRFIIEDKQWKLNIDDKIILAENKEGNLEWKVDK